MLKKLSILALVIILAFAVVACGGGDSGSGSGATADPVAAFLAEYGDEINEEFADIAGFMGGGRVEVSAGTGNNEMVFTFELDVELGEDGIDAIFNVLGGVFYDLAEDFADEIEVDSVRITIRISDSEGNSVSRSFDS